MVKTSDSRDLFAGALELMILQTLKRHPMHGYALAQHIKAVSDDLLQIEEGSLYPALQRLLKAGFLRSEMGLSARNRPVRVYKLTAAVNVWTKNDRASRRCSPASTVFSRLRNRRRVTNAMAQTSAHASPSLP